MYKLLVAMDFSEIAPAILAQAEFLARATKGKVWLIHVAPPEPDFIGYDTGPQTERDYIARQFWDEHRQLQERAEELRQKEIDAIALLLQGPTVETIVTEANKLAANLIVVGSHGRRGLDRVLVGSVSSGILQKAPCPVFVIPAHLQGGEN
ncbi:MAG: universal stress protein [Cyanobacteriota bacterium]|nr:universal stress protein [Cyanobacteriota bacterium]